MNIMLDRIRILRMDDDVCCRVECYENPDWGFARNYQLILKSVFAEYSASVFNTSISSSVGLLYGGNRDYHWQGLIIGPVDGKLIKIIDGVYYKPIDEDILNPISAISCIDRIIYEYKTGNGCYKVLLSLRDVDGYVELNVKASKPSFFALPLDIRNAESMVSYKYTICRYRGYMEVNVLNSLLKVIVKGIDDIENWGEWINWIYKLGDGFRTLSNGDLRFIKYVRSIYIPVLLKSLSGSLNIAIPISVKRCLKPNLTLNLNINADPIIRDLIELRVRRLASFGVPFNSLIAPEAGAWWFRRVWIRDLVEGLRWNLKTYIYVLGWKSWITELIMELLRISWINNGTPILPSSKSFSSDAFPQLINVATELSRLTGSSNLLEKVLKIMFRAIKKLRGNKFSASKIMDGVIVSKPNSSWIDSMVSIDGVKWPMRLPTSWIGRVGVECEFALVEVNALYLEATYRLLSLLNSLGVTVPLWLKDFYYELRDGFRKWFINGSLPPLTVNIPLGLTDNTLSSAGIVAASTLKDIVYEDIRGMWRDVEKLIVKRKLIFIGSGEEVFGVLTRINELKPYLGDMEYHGSVIWPRDTPYLIEFMKKLSMDVKGILLNNLDHMVCEGAVGYVSELFSLPLGVNPSPSIYSMNPVPVKNPAQYWSHWCDPYLDYFKSNSDL
ncbi:MAG: hypothetical protein QXY40_03605 [Candidatus Methanomethylicia archaeon]